MTKAKHRFAKTLLEIPRGSLYYQGVALESDNLNICWDAFILYVASIKDVLCISDGCANEGRIIKMLKVLDGLDVFVVLSQLSAWSDKLLQSVEDESVQYEDFKLPDTADTASEFLGILGGLISRCLRDWLSSANEASFRVCRQVYEFLKRLTIRDERLNQVAFTAWWSVEDSSPDPVVPDGLKRLAQDWFPIEDTALLIEDFIPHHGGGAVREGNISITEKYLLNGFDEKLKRFLKTIGWDVDDKGLMQRCCLYPVDPIAYHKVLFVPKSYKVYRTVSMEPTAYQFLMEGAASAIFRYLRSRYAHCGCWKHYCVDTEEWNRQLSYEGSIDGSYATIDLSSASDSVSLKLVEEVLGKTCLHPFLLLRTEFAEFPRNEEFGGSVYKVRKFAPMGSALCFPIESIIFTLITEYCVLRTPGAKRRFYVYGDDIVVDVKVVPMLLSVLAQLGFVVNVDKSFYNTNGEGRRCRGFFRESCGAEYLNGINVAPKRLSRHFSGFSFESPRSLPQLLSLANDLFDLRSTRKVLLTELLVRSKLPIVFDSDGLIGVKSDYPTNYHLDSRWNKDYQREEVFGLVLRRKRKGVSYGLENFETVESFLGEIRLYEYLRSAQQTRREHCLYPEDKCSAPVEPYEYELEVSLEWVERPVSTPAYTTEGSTTNMVA